MSLETVQTAPEQPAQVAQTSSETKVSGKMGQSDFARMLAAKQAPVAAPIPATPEAAAPVTTEAKQEEAAKAPAAEETTVATEETATAETEAAAEESEEVLSPEAHALDPKLQAKIDRRIGKEVGKTKKAIAEAATAKARVAELEAQLSNRPDPEEREVHVPVPSNVPLAEIVSIDALNQYKETLANDIVEAEMLLYSDFPPEGKQTKWGHITKDALISALTQAKKTERTEIPARERFLTTRTTVQQTAQEKFPFLKDPAHPGYQMAKQALRENPVLRAYPNSDYLVGLLVKGQLAMQAEEAAKTTAKPAVTKPRPKPTAGQSEIASDASITRAPTGMMSQNALQSERANATGGKKSLNGKDFAKLLLANQRFRNSQ